MEGYNKEGFGCWFVEKEGCRAFVFSPLTIGLVRESQGTRGFLEEKCIKVTVSIYIITTYMLP